MTLLNSSLYVMASIYILAGLLHFLQPQVFLKIMPPYIPFHRAMVLLSGIAEILLGFGLLFPATREYAAWGIIALLIAVFPANIEQVRSKGARLGLPMWAVIARLPLQLVLIWWAWLYT